MDNLGFEVDDLFKQFRSGTDHVVAVNGIRLSIPPGQFVVIVGPNGSGKSTLLNLIAGDFLPDRGRIDWVSEEGSRGNWTDMSPRLRASRMARVLQDPQAGTVPELTIEDHLRLVFSGRIPSPLQQQLRSAGLDVADQLLEQVGLRGRRKTYVADLSGGLRQMLTLVLAVARRPKVLLLDEHTASLDMTNAAICMTLSEKLCKEQGITAFMVTHRLSDAVRFGDRLLVFCDGRIIADYSQEEKAKIDSAELIRLWEPA